VNANDWHWPLIIDFSNDFSVSSSFLDLADDFSITCIRVVRQAPKTRMGRERPPYLRKYQ
jgi:hypothetical protein